MALRKGKNGRDHKVDQVEIAQMGPPWLYRGTLVPYDDFGKMTKY